MRAKPTWKNNNNKQSNKPEREWSFFLSLCLFFSFFVCVCVDILFLGMDVVVVCRKNKELISFCLLVLVNFTQKVDHEIVDKGFIRNGSNHPVHGS